MQNGKKNILIRADSNSFIGSGHVMRCLALAQAWQKEQGSVDFLMEKYENSSIENRLKSEGYNVHHISSIAGSCEDAVETASFASKINTEWVILDGYHFSDEYQKIVKEANLKQLFIDDYGHAKHYYADIILNQNIYANESLYRNRESYTKLFLGLNYSLIRSEFSKWNNQNIEISKRVKRILVTLGGGDPDNQTLKVVHALNKSTLKELEVIIVVGGANPHLKEIEKVVRDISYMKLMCNVNNINEIMAETDLSISAGGSTCWELALMGIPNITLIIAENQIKIAEGLATVGAASNLGWFEDVNESDILNAVVKISKDYELRELMSNSGRELVDGLGSTRVVSELLNRNNFH